MNLSRIPTPPAHEPGPNDATAPAVDGEAYLHRFARPAVTINLLLGVTMVAAGWSVLPAAVLLGWLALLAAANLARLAPAAQLLATPDEEQCIRLHRHLVALVLVSGVIWGIGAVVLLGNTRDTNLQFLTLVVLAGLTAGSIPMLAMDFRVYAGYLLTLAVPLIGWFLLGAPSEQGAIGVVLSVYFAAMAFAGRNYADAFGRSRQFAHDLSLARDRTERANARLQRQYDDALRIQEALRASEHRFHAVFEQAPIGMALLNTDSRLVQVNPMLAELLCYRVEDLIGCRISALVLDEDLAGFRQTIHGLLSGRQTRAQADMRFTRADGQTLWASVAMATVTQDASNERYVIVQVQDITDAVKLSARLQYEASHDHLTGFSNRREFERHLMRVLAGNRGDNVRHTLCYLDLDRFKTINDTQGHIAGDEILRQIASILHEHLRGGDSIARIGGDEFAILLEHCDIDAARRICETLVTAVHEFRFRWNDSVFRLDLSVGIAAVTPDLRDTYEALKHADAACAAAKEAGGARVHVYRSQDEHIKRRQGETRWIGPINEALESDGFELFGQPIIATMPARETERVRFEVLLRMPDSERPELLPSAFLPAAERYGLASRLDRWVIAGVFDWFRKNPAAARQVDSCAINLSGASLGDTEFTEHVMNEIRGAPLSPAQLQFEITETAAIGRLTQAGHFMRLVRGLGCRFALDDFGSGLSSFGYLRSLPVDTLKIDGQFVRDIIADDVDRALVKSINDIGHVLGLHTIAECVEDETTLALLRDMGVDYVQGWHVGSPVPLAELFPTERAGDSPSPPLWS